MDFGIARSIGTAGGGDSQRQRPLHTWCVRRNDGRRGCRDHPLHGAGAGKGPDGRSPRRRLCVWPDSSRHAARPRSAGGRTDCARRTAEATRCRAGVAENVRSDYSRTARPHCYSMPRSRPGRPLSNGGRVGGRPQSPRRQGRADPDQSASWAFQLLSRSACCCWGCRLGSGGICGRRLRRSRTTPFPW